MTSCSSIFKWRPMKDTPDYQPGEETANVITHAIGCVLSVAALIAIIVDQTKHYDKYKLIGMLIFAFSLLTLYFVSTFYHGVTDPKWKKVFRYGDHCCIYLLIAGSYAPFCFTVLREYNGIVVTAVEWSIAAVGIFLKIMWFDMVENVSLLYYIVMGWVAIMTIGTLIQTLPSPGLYFMIASGLSYTLGTFFFARFEVAYTHAIWHLFVVLGSVFTFIAAFWYC